MQPAPNPPNPLIPTLHHPTPNPPIPLSIRVPQQIHLQQYLPRLQIPDTDRLTATVCVAGADEGVRSRASAEGLDAHFDAGVGGGEGGQCVAEEGVHAFGGAGPVTVVEGEGC